VLTRRRVSLACAACAALVCCAAVTAPGAAAATAVRARPASFGPGTGTRLINDLANAWKITQGGGVTVAVLSTGVDPSVTGLAGKVRTGPDYVDLPYPVPFDGTLLASAIAGSGPTSASPSGPIGRAPQAKILSIRIAPDSAVPGAAAWSKAADWDSQIARGITAAARDGAEVIYVDAYADSSSAQLEQAVAYATSKNAVVIVSEYENGPGSNVPTYPGSLPGVLGAGTAFLPGLTPPSKEAHSPSNESILVSAPGDQLAVSSPSGLGYATQNIYSAGAWLTGTVALIKAVYPSLPPALVARAIALSARDHPPGGYNTTVGFGLINPAGALQEASVLSKLGSTAAPGPGVASPSARLAAGPAPGVIDAVHHSVIKLAAFGAAILAGLVCLVLAALLARRWRRQGSVRIS
jgi:Subtilase family